MCINIRAGIINGMLTQVGRLSFKFCMASYKRVPSFGARYPPSRGDKRSKTLFASRKQNCWPDFADLVGSVYRPSAGEGGGLLLLRDVYDSGSDVPGENGFLRYVSS